MRIEEDGVAVCEWQEFREIFASNHEQGEHVAISGPTGSGKSVLGVALCEIISERINANTGRPTSVTVLGSKPQDATLNALHHKGWPIITKWPPAYGQEHCIVWPHNRKWGATDMARRQRPVFRRLLDRVFQEGGQTIFIDEAAYFERAQPNGLGLSSTMENYWSAARSNSLTAIAATQRPRHVTLLMWSEPAWLVIFRPEDDRDLDTISRASGHRFEVYRAVKRLGGFEFVCIRRKRDGSRALYVSRYQDH